MITELLLTKFTSWLNPTLVGLKLLKDITDSVMILGV